MSTTLIVFIHILCGLITAVSSYIWLFRGLTRDEFESEINEMSVPIFGVTLCFVVLGPVSLLLIAIIFLCINEKIKKFRRNLLFKFVNVGLKSVDDKNDNNEEG